MEILVAVDVLATVDLRCVQVAARQLSLLLGPRGGNAALNRKGTHFYEVSHL